MSHRWTAEEARQQGIAGAVARWNAPRPCTTVQPSTQPDGSENPIANDIACACAETLRQLRKTNDAKEKVALARALRDLRETWHLVTGEAKPGNRKPSSPPQRQIRRELNPQPYEPPVVP
jgi:hypothetical protein